MSLHPCPIGRIPAETMRVAQAAFPRGTVVTRLRNEFADVYRDEDFAALRQAADAVRSRLIGSTHWV